MTTRVLEWGVAMRARQGEVESGDRHVVRAFPDGVLLGVIDGLGHGAEAAVAADLAVEAIRDQPPGNLIAIVKACHERVRRTRGVVMSLGSFNAREATLTWLGVGNVEGALSRRSERASRIESLLLRGGVVGSRLPPLVAAVLPVAAGDTLVFATDGVAGNFRSAVVPDEAPQQIADRILTHHGKSTDDALVLVARYVGLP